MSTRTFGSRTVEKIIGNERVTITVKMVSLGASAPYLSVSGEARSKYAGKDTEPLSSVQIQDGYARHFPELRKYFKWHLVSVGSGPIHYLVNTLFWLDRAASGGDNGLYGSGVSAERCQKNAELTALWGVLPGEEQGGLVYDAVTQVVLEERLPELLDTFNNDTIELFGDKAVIDANWATAK